MVRFILGKQNKKCMKELEGGSGYKKCTYFYRAIEKYGWDNFEHLVLKKVLSSDEADFYEKFYIKKYKSNDPKFGYNLTGRWT